MIVVDANVVAFLLLGHVPPRRLQAERALRKDPHWAAPLLWRSEFRNILCGEMRQRNLPVAEALRFLDLAGELFRGADYQVESSQVMRLVSSAPHSSAYDCEYVALAGDLGTSMVTADRGILEDFPNLTIPLEMFGAP